MSRRTYPRRAQRQTMRRSQENWNLSISSLPTLRTLKRPERKEVERQRATKQWILPEVRDPTRVHNRLVYRRATLMGLPAELRQQILYMSYSMTDLEADLNTGLERGKLLLGNYPASHANKATTTMIQGVIDNRLNLLRLSRRQGTLIVLLGRRIEELSGLAPMIRDDMEYVSKCWQQDFESQIGREIKNRLSGQAMRLRNVAKSLELLHDQAFSDPRGGQPAKPGKNPLRKKFRPALCWYCTERHADKDLTCPMARKTPAKWVKMTKKVGGWRSRVAALSTFKGKKVIFDD